MPQATQNSVENELHRRMVVSGEWDRINQLLKRGLDESGWTDTVTDHAREECRQAPRLNVRSVERNVAPDAHASIPAEVKASIIEEIRQFIEDNLRP